MRDNVVSWKWVICFLQFFSQGRKRNLWIDFPITGDVQSSKHKVHVKMILAIYYWMQSTNPVVLDFMLRHCINFINICHIWSKSNVNISSVLKPIYLFKLFSSVKNIFLEIYNKSMFGYRVIFQQIFFFHKTVGFIFFTLCMHRNLFNGKPTAGSISFNFFKIFLYILIII